MPGAMSPLQGLGLRTSARSQGFALGCAMTPRRGSEPGAPLPMESAGRVADRADVAFGHEGVPSLLRLGAPSAHGAPGFIIRLGAGAIKGKIGDGRSGRQALEA